MVVSRVTGGLSGCKGKERMSARVVWQRGFAWREGVATGRRGVLHTCCWGVVDTCASAVRTSTWRRAHGVSLNPWGGYPSGTPQFRQRDGRVPSPSGLCLLAVSKVLRRYRLGLVKGALGVAW